MKFPSKFIKCLQIFQLGFNKAAILESVEKEKFEDIHATYLLLGERKSDVSCIPYKIKSIFNSRFH